MTIASATPARPGENAAHEVSPRKGGRGVPSTATATSVRGTLTLTTPSSLRSGAATPVAAATAATTRGGDSVTSPAPGTAGAPLACCTGPLDLAFMEMEIWHDWAPLDQDALDSAFASGYGELFRELEGSSQGVLIFQCRACGRIYVGSCTP